MKKNEHLAKIQNHYKEMMDLASELHNIEQIFEQTKQEFKEKESDFLNSKLKMNSRLNDLKGDLLVLIENSIFADPD